MTITENIVHALVMVKEANSNTGSTKGGLKAIGLELGVLASSGRKSVIRILDVGLPHETENIRKSHNFGEK
jgi:hypothetical protein